MTVPNEYNVVDGLLGLGSDINIEILAAMKQILDA
jgi:hypothetical protein